MRHHHIRTACVLGFVLGAFNLTARAQLTSFTVNTTSDAIVSRACDNGVAGCSLRGAIAAANATTGGASIVFSIPPSDSSCSAGVCSIRITTPLPTITRASVSLVGTGADRLFILPANGVNISRAITVDLNSGSVSVSGIGISGASSNGTGFGGGILKSGTGSLQLSDVHIVGNLSTTGAGVWVTAGTATITRSSIFANSAQLGNGGGGIAVNAGAICNVINTTISDNTSAGTGGAGIANYGVLSITNSTVMNNSAIHATPGILSHGGGILNMNGTVNVKSTIIARNNAADAGPDIFGNFNSSGFNLVGKVDAGTGFITPTDLTGVGPAPLDPRFESDFVSYNGGRTPTVPLLPDSPAIDKGTSTGLTGTLLTDQRNGGFGRRRDNPLVSNASGGDGTDIGAYERHISPNFDFDGDGRTDIGIFRPTGGEWWISPSKSRVVYAEQFGAATDRIVPADFTGDGKTDVAIWRPGTGEWFVVRSENSTFFGFAFGTNGDIPAPADFDGDRKADPTVFRPSTGNWFSLRSAGGLAIQQFGANGDVPIAADYDGDGRADVAIHRPSLGQWWINRSTAGVVAFTFGVSTDKPVPGDFTGDNKTDVAFFRPSTGEWYVIRSEDTSFFGFTFGTNGDVAAPGDYDGDAKFDATVFRPSIATWFSLLSTSGIAIEQFGLNGDRPVPNAFVP